MDLSGKVCLSLGFSYRLFLFYFIYLFGGRAWGILANDIDSDQYIGMQPFNHATINPSIGQ